MIVRTFLAHIFRLCVYHPPESCTFLDEFMSFIGFLSSIKCVHYICGYFNIHVDVSVGDCCKLMTFLDSYNLKQSVSQPTHLQSHMHYFILSSGNHATTVYVKICDFIFAHE